jgi:hypothetical protein
MPGLRLGLLIIGVRLSNSSRVSMSMRMRTKDDCCQKSPFASMTSSIIRPSGRLFSMDRLTPVTSCHSSTRKQTRLCGMHGGCRKAAFWPHCAYERLRSASPLAQGRLHICQGLSSSLSNRCAFHSFCSFPWDRGTRLHYPRAPQGSHLFVTDYL